MPRDIERAHARAKERFKATRTSFSPRRPAWYQFGIIEVGFLISKLAAEPNAPAICAAVGRSRAREPGTCCARLTAGCIMLKFTILLQLPRQAPRENVFNCGRY